MLFSASAFLWLGPYSSSRPELRSAVLPLFIVLPPAKQHGWCLIAVVCPLGCPCSSHIPYWVWSCDTWIASYVKICKCFMLANTVLWTVTTQEVGSFPGCLWWWSGPVAWFFQTIPAERALMQNFMKMIIQRVGLLWNILFLNYVIQSEIKAKSLASRRMLLTKKSVTSF